jgi:hypothetical protein
MKKLILLSLLLIGCSEQKKIQKAKHIVLFNEKAFNEVGIQWAKLNPIDTAITKVVYKSDTITLRDTLTYNHFDTLNNVDTVFKIVLKTMYVHDTVQKYVQDNRVLNSYKDTIQSYKNNLFITNTYLLESKKEISKYKWYFFGLLGLIVLILGIYIYLKLAL